MFIIPETITFKRLNLDNRSDLEQPTAQVHKSARLWTVFEVSWCRKQEVHILGQWREFFRNVLLLVVIVLLYQLVLGHATRCLEM